MVQNIKTVYLTPSQKAKAVEKPYSLYRIFVSILTVLGTTAWYPSKISFDDPSFSSFYLLAGADRRFEARGEDIFQGDIWVKNESTISLNYAISEILY